MIARTRRAVGLGIKPIARWTCSQSWRIHRSLMGLVRYVAPSLLPSLLGFAQVTVVNLFALPSHSTGEIAEPESGKEGGWRRVTSSVRALTLPTEAYWLTVPRHRRDPLERTFGGRSIGCTRVLRSTSCPPGTSAPRRATCHGGSVGPGQTQVCHLPRSSGQPPAHLPGYCRKLD